MPTLEEENTIFKVNHMVLASPMLFVTLFVDVAIVFTRNMSLVSTPTQDCHLDAEVTFFVATHSVLKLELGENFGLL